MTAKWTGSVVVAAGAAVLILGVTMAARSQSHASRGPQPAAWTQAVKAVDDAVSRHDLGTATWAAAAAYRTALASPGWEGIVEAGDAYLRVGEADGLRRDAEAQARRAYLTALFRARRQRSLDGVLRVAETFADLGDREVTAHCLHVADGLARSSGDPDASARVTATRTRLAARL